MHDNYLTQSDSAFKDIQRHFTKLLLGIQLQGLLWTRLLDILTLDTRHDPASA